MATSSIEWTMRVWNPTTGCNKISPGCKNCYAEIMHRRLMAMQPKKYSRPFNDGAFPHEPSLDIPLKWRKSSTIFVDSMSDLFHKNISIDYIAKVYAIMFLCERHAFQILTKRPERRLEVFKSDEFYDLLCKYCNQFHDKFIKPLEQELYLHDEIKSLFPFKNIWEGTSTENQEQADERIFYLLQTPAKVRWISAEPLIGEINLRKSIGRLAHVKLDWVVVGGESGHGKRPFNPDWARAIRDVCAENDVAFFMKQWDKVKPIPEDLMIREFPEHVQCEMLDALRI